MAQGSRLCARGLDAAQNDKADRQILAKTGDVPSQQVSLIFDAEYRVSRIYSTRYKCKLLRY